MGGIADLYKKIPTNIRLYGESMVGMDSPITEQDFAPEELEFMRNQIAQKKLYNLDRESKLAKSPLSDEDDWKKISYGEDGEPYIEYYDLPESELQKKRDKKLQSYDDTRDRTSIKSGSDYVWDESGESALKSFGSDVAYQVWSTLGSYRAVDTPDGGLKINDIYHWEKFKDAMAQKGTGGSIKDIIATIASGKVREAAQKLATLLASDDNRRNVDINLSATEMPKNYRAGGRVRLI